MKKNFLGLSLVLLTALLVNLSAVYATPNESSSNSQDALYKEEIKKVKATATEQR